MYKMAICDDEHSTCIDLKELIEKIAVELKQTVEIDLFLSGEELVEHLREGVRYDLVFLDIKLESMDGIDVGRCIREELRDYKSLIIYISSYENYAMKLFQVQPFDFLIKPLNHDEIHKVILKGIRWIKGSKSILEYSKNKSVYSVNCNDIMYIYSDRKKIVLVLTNGKKEQFYGKLKDIVKCLPDCFSVINQSFVINRNYVQKYSYEQIVMMDNNTLLISRANRKAIREIITPKKTERG